MRLLGRPGNCLVMKSCSGFVLIGISIQYPNENTGMGKVITLARTD